MQSKDIVKLNIIIEVRINYFNKMWLSKRLIGKQMLSLPSRFFNQIAMTPESINLHKKRESTAIFDPDMIPDDAILTQSGAIQNPYLPFSWLTKVDSKTVDEMIETNYRYQQEFKRKYAEPRNLTFEEKHYRNIGDNEVADEKFAEIFR